MLKSMKIEDNTPFQYGENGHVEYGWSYDLRERILQLNFQLVRTDMHNLCKINNVYNELLCELILKYNLSASSLEKDIAFELLKILYKMIGYTRDIIDGKGEYTLSYMMIYSWYFISPALAAYALKSLVSIKDYEHPYGSWKDIKYFCNYCISMGVSKDHYLINHAIDLMNSQIKEDLDKVENNNNTILNQNISLVSKWVPREKSKKFGWLHEKLSINFFPHYIETAKTEVSLKRAILKCTTEFRKKISLLNKIIDTPQIKQCNHDWGNINFDNVTSITLTKQKKAFLNIQKDGSQRSKFKDRMICANNFKNYVQKITQGEIPVKGKRVGLNDFTKEAFNLIKSKETNKTELDLLNAQWKENSKQNENLGKIIPMIDVSAIMEGDPMYAAIGLGIRLAEKSMLGKRIMMFGSRPIWINLDSCEEFTDMVKKIQQSEELGKNANFYAALDMILNSMIETRMTPEEAQDLMLVIFSDMQMDESMNNNKELYSKIKEKYEITGIIIHGKAYKMPHILFWNLRSTSGFPTLSTQPNCSMMSGYNPVLLNTFCEMGMNAFQSCTSWSLFIKNIENKRYKQLGDKISEILLGK